MLYFLYEIYKFVIYSVYIMNDKWSEVILGRGEDIILLNIILVYVYKDLVNWEVIIVFFIFVLVLRNVCSIVIKYIYFYNDMVVTDILTVFVIKCNKNW